MKDIKKKHININYNIALYSIMLFSLFSMFFWGKLQDVVALCPCLCSRFPTLFHLSLCCPSAGIQLRSQVNFFPSPLHIFINFKLTHKLEIVCACISRVQTFIRKIMSELNVKQSWIAHLHEVVIYSYLYITINNMKFLIGIAKV